MVVVFVLMVVMMATASTMAVNVSQKSGATAQREADRAFTVAEAGLDLALYELQTGVDIAGDGLGVTTAGILGGTFSVTVTPPVAGAGEYTVQSTANVNRTARALQAVVVQQNDVVPPFLGLSGVSMGGNGLVDSYDSSVGTYASQVGGGGFALSDGNLQTNGDISLTGNAVVYGDATPGMGGSVTGNVGNVMGSTAPATSTFSVDPYVYSPAIPASGSFSGSGTLAAGAYRYTTFKMSSKQGLVVNGDVELYVDGSFQITGQGFIEITPGSSLVIHHGSGDFTAAGGSIVNGDQLASQLEVKSASTGVVKFAGSSDFVGTVFAPQAEFKSVGNAAVFGSIVADTLDISGNGNLHYDVALGAGGATSWSVQIIRQAAP